MSTHILGISAFYHDSAAALIRDGEIVAAAQEERFSRVKHDPRLPEQAIRYCLEAAGLGAADLDHVVFYERPWEKFDRLLATHAAFAPAGFDTFRRSISIWARQKLRIPQAIAAALGGEFRGTLHTVDHHEAHAASAFYPSPFSEAAILTLDAVGEWTTSSLGLGCGHGLCLTHDLRFPHSLGMLYSAFTYYTGFKVNSGEYKLMGLAPYGRPRFVDVILEKLAAIREDGSLWLDMSYFNYCQGSSMTSERFHRLFGGPPRRPESFLTQKDMDLAAS
ncbi:MAG: carbamoyltransferase N-terminal domain-containing protein, partial [Candidatus Methylomirabilales bacterium]